MTGSGALEGIFDDLERAGDALQLAAAVIACDERTGLLPFVTLDDPLAEAARREGFRVLPTDAANAESVL